MILKLKCDHIVKRMLSGHDVMYEMSHCIIMAFKVGIRINKKKLVEIIFHNLFFSSYGNIYSQLKH